MTYRFKKQYLYQCKECGKERSTTRESRAEAGICQSCIASRVPEEQMSLFGGGVTTLWIRWIISLLWQQKPTSKKASSSTSRIAVIFTGAKIPAQWRSERVAAAAS